jgi:hypothetical protein
MATAFDRDQLLAAFDEIGMAAVSARAHLDIAVFSGSALMLASNFRFSTEGVDIYEIGRPWPVWLSGVVEGIAARNCWPPEWLNEAVTFHVSPLANPARDLIVLGTFPRASEQVGLTVFVPTARYMLALKLKALRVSEFDSRHPHSCRVLPEKRYRCRQTAFRAKAPCFRRKPPRCAPLPWPKHMS